MSVFKIKRVRIILKMIFKRIGWFLKLLTTLPLNLTVSFAGRFPGKHANFEMIGKRWGKKQIISLRPFANFILILHIDLFYSSEVSVFYYILVALVKGIIVKRNNSLFQAFNNMCSITVLPIWNLAALQPCWSVSIFLVRICFCHYIYFR